MSDLGGFSMYELFRAEVDTHCAALSDGLLKLESTPDDIGIIVPLMRAAHSIKGAARIVGIDAAVAVAHHMEDALVRIQKGQERTTRGRIDQLLEGTDLLQRISQQKESDLPEWSTQNASEINTLTIALSAAPTATPEPAAPVAAAPVAAAPVEPAAPPVPATQLPPHQSQQRQSPLTPAPLLRHQPHRDAWTPWCNARFPPLTCPPRRPPLRWLRRSRAPYASMLTTSTA